MLDKGKDILAACTVLSSEVTGRHKELGGIRIRTADPDWPKGYSMLHVLQKMLENSGELVRGCCHCLETDCALVGRC